MDFIIGGLAAMGASVFSNPFDVLKTRMQLQGELKARGHHAIHYKNTFHAAYVVAKNEGIRGLQKGLGTALIMHSVRNSVRLGTYQSLSNHGFICDSEGKTILYKSLLASSFSGAAGAFFGSPFFLIKTQLQSQAAEAIAVGHQHGHSGLTAALRTIYVKHGVWWIVCEGFNLSVNGDFQIKGLWRGANATMLRAVAGSSAQLTSFAKAKDFLREYEVFRHSTVLTAFGASIVGGIVQTLCMTPFDLVSTRLYNQGNDETINSTLYFIKILSC